MIAPVTRPAAESFSRATSHRDLDSIRHDGHAPARRDAGRLGGDPVEHRRADRPPRRHRPVDDDLLALGVLRRVSRGRRGRLVEVIRETGWPGILMAACFAIASTSFIMALSRTSVANTLIIQSLSPFIAGLLGWVCLGEHVRRR